MLGVFDAVAAVATTVLTRDGLIGIEQNVVRFVTDGMHDTLQPCRVGSLNHVTQLIDSSI